MGVKHVRMMCCLITWNFVEWNHGIVEARYKHVRAVRLYKIGTIDSL